MPFYSHNIVYGLSSRIRVIGQKLRESTVTMSYTFSSTKTNRRQKKKKSAKKNSFILVTHSTKTQMNSNVQRTRSPHEILVYFHNLHLVYREHTVTHIRVNSLKTIAKSLSFTEFHPQIFYSNESFAKEKYEMNE